MSVVYSCGNFHVEAVNVAGRRRTVFRVCEYRGTDSILLDTFEGVGFQSGLRLAIVSCELRASRALDVPRELS